jgi:hypothetical protein
MSFIDRGDEEFERTLLRSASGDVPAPEASARAWARFAATMAGVALTLATTGVPAPFAAATPGRRFAGAVAAVKKLAIGAIGGSVVTLALVGRHAVPAGSIAPSSTIRSSPVAVAPLAHAAPSAWDPPEAYPSPSAAAPLSTSRNPGRSVGKRDSQVTAAPGSSRPGTSAAEGEARSLAAEVAALDVARSVLDAGRPDETLALLGRYLAVFPRGKLLPEAGVLRIEALAASGDRARVIGEAVRFLAQYPNAPQRARVELLRDEGIAPTP